MLVIHLWNVWANAGQRSGVNRSGLLNYVFFKKMKMQVIQLRDKPGHNVLGKFAPQKGLEYAVVKMEARWCEGTLQNSSIHVVM